MRKDGWKCGVHIEVLIHSLPCRHPDQCRQQRLPTSTDITIDEPLMKKQAVFRIKLV